MKEVQRTNEWHQRVYTSGEIKKLLNVPQHASLSVEQRANGHVYIEFSIEGEVTPVGSE